jgi:tetratricopeptide (TPR) repeat protein
MNAAEVSTYWYGQAWKEMGQRPALSLARFWRKLRWSLGNTEISDTRTYEFYEGRFDMFRLPLWGFAALSVFGLPGMLLVLRDRRFVPHVAFVVLYAASLSAFFVYGRYRLPLAVPLAILGAAAISRAYDLVAARQWPRLLAASLLLPPVAWFAYGHVPATGPSSFFTDYFNQGNKYYNLARYAPAAAEYEKALFVRPGDHPAVPLLAVALADLYVQLGNQARAEAMLRQMLANGTADPAVARKLATLVGAARDR